MFQFASGGEKIRETRNPHLGFVTYGPKHWRIVDRSTGNCIGPIYKSKTELLADLTKFAESRGFN